MKHLLIIALFTFPICYGCRNKLKTKNDREPSYYCSIVDTLIFNYEHNNLSNNYMTEKLSILYKKTGIYDRSEKNIMGSTYPKKEVFYSDMSKYRVALRCK